MELQRGIPTRFRGTGLSLKCNGCRGDCECECSTKRRLYKGELCKVYFKIVFVFCSD